MNWVISEDVLQNGLTKQELSEENKARQMKTGQKQKGVVHIHLNTNKVKDVCKICLPPSPLTFDLVIRKNKGCDNQLYKV